MGCPKEIRRRLASEATAQPSGLVGCAQGLVRRLVTWTDAGLRLTRMMVNWSLGAGRESHARTRSPSEGDRSFHSIGMARSCSEGTFDGDGA